MKKLLIVDGSNLACRSYYTKPFSFFSMLNKATQRVDPTHVAFAFDSGRKGWRHERYPAYKANRKPKPPELERWIVNLVTELTLADLGVFSDCEADDMINALVLEYESTYLPFDDYHIFILSSDKDMYALADIDCTILDFEKRVTKYGESYVQIEIDRKSVYSKLGVWPFQVPSLKALRGGHDNIPGIKGIGEKSAQALLGAFTSIENIYDDIDDIDHLYLRSKKRIKQLLLDGKEQVMLSLELSEIGVSAEEINIDRCVAPGWVQLDQVITNLKEAGF